MAMKKMSILLTLIIGLSLIFTACSENTVSPVEKKATETVSAKPKEVVELSFVNWATAEKATEEKFNKVIKAFESENPNIKIKSVAVPFSEIQNQLTVMTTAGNAPDIAQVEASVGVSLAAMGALEPIDALLSKDFAANLNKSYYDIGLYDKGHYLIPWGGGTNGFWYNKKILAEAGLDPNNPPKTMKELDDAMVQIKKLKDIVPLQYDTSPRAFATAFQWSFMKTISNEPFNTKSVQVKTMTAYAEWLRNLVAKGYTLPGKKLGEFRPLGAQNRLAFAIDAPLYKGTLQSLDTTLTDEKFYETWGVTTLPAGADGKSYTVGGSDHYNVVFKASKHKAEAAKFLEFIADSDTALKEYVIPMGFLPVTSSALQRFPENFNNPITKAFMEKIVPTTVIPPFGPNFTSAASVLATNLQEVITTSKPIDGILGGTQVKLESIIEGK